MNLEPLGKPHKEFPLGILEPAQTLVTPRSGQNRVSLQAAPASLATQRLARAKIAFTTRRVPVEQMATLLEGNLVPRSGDLVLARVAKLGQHAALELAGGRRSRLFRDDEIIVCYGNRYAPDQYEAEVPQNLYPCDLVAAGGVASKVISRHSLMRPATAIEPAGLVGDAHGRGLNIADWSLAPILHDTPVPTALAVVGTSMNSGKTTTVANLIRGLANAGLNVGAAKVTGTGSPGDPAFFRDAGAAAVLDFTDAGVPSTYRIAPERVERIFDVLVCNLARSQVDVIVLEVADGLYQSETRALVSSRIFRDTVDAILFAAMDAMGATAGVEWLRHHALPVVAVSGLLTASPLAISEARQIVGLPVVAADSLIGADIPHQLGLRFRGKQLALCKRAQCALCKSS
jgi:hypothetical protein